MNLQLSLAPPYRGCLYVPVSSKLVEVVIMNPERRVVANDQFTQFGCEQESVEKIAGRLLVSNHVVPPRRLDSV